MLNSEIVCSSVLMLGMHSEMSEVTIGMIVFLCGVGGLLIGMQNQLPIKYYHI